MDGCEHPLLDLPGTVKASQEIVISGFCQKAFVASKIVSWFGNCIWDGFPGGTVTGWPFLLSQVDILKQSLKTCSEGKTESRL